MALIDGKQLRDGSVAGAKIVPGGIDTAQLATDAVDNTILDLADTYDFAGEGGDVQVADTPAGSSSTVNKKYVDDRLHGLSPKDACKVATAAALPAYTAAGSGVGKTITINATGTLTIDGVQVLLGDRVLVKDEVASGSPGQYDHGIYECTVLGEVGVQAELTRALDFDGSPSGEVEDGDYTWIGQGTVNHDQQWSLTTNDPITVDSTDLVFSQTGGTGAYSAGDGLTESPTNTFNVGEKDGTGGGSPGGAIKVNSNDVELQVAAAGGLEITDVAADPGELQVKAGGITETMLNSSVAGNGISGGGGSKLAVDPDTSTGGNVANVVNVAAAGVGVRIDDDTIKENGSNQLKAATKTVGDKNLGVSTTTADDDPTGVSISKTPAGDHMVLVFVNGAKQVLKGDKTGDCFFSADAGLNAVAISAIVATNTLHWIGSTAGFELAAATDKISLDYDTAA